MPFFKKICPICVLVSLTWMTMLTLKWLGYDVNDELLAMLMGGSVVGVSSVLGARLHSTVQTMYWKLIAIPVGFAALYALLQFAWGYVTGMLVVYALVWVLFRTVGHVQRNGNQLDDITKKLDACCQ